MVNKKRAAFVNSAPEELPAGAPKEAIRREFAKRLQHFMVERGWNQSELARQAAKHVESGTFGRDNVSGYVRGLVLPGPVHLNALAKALHKTVDELLPNRTAPSADDSAPPLDIRDIGGGNAWLQVNQGVSWDVALEIAKILKG